MAVNVHRSGTLLSTDLVMANPLLGAARDAINTIDSTVPVTEAEMPLELAKLTLTCFI